MLWLRLLRSTIGSLILVEIRTHSSVSCQYQSVVSSILLDLVSSVLVRWYHRRCGHCIEMTCLHQISLMRIFRVGNTTELALQEISEFRGLHSRLCHDHEVVWISANQCNPDKSVLLYVTCTQWRIQGGGPRGHAPPIIIGRFLCTLFNEFSEIFLDSIIDLSN